MCVLRVIANRSRLFSFQKDRYLIIEESCGRNVTFCTQGHAAMMFSVLFELEWFKKNAQVAA
jgi:hypothetical protein